MFFAIKRLENESDKAYKAFETYYNLKSGRTRKKCSLLLGHKTSYTCEKWSQSYNWDERIRDYENKIIDDLYEKSLEKIVKVNDKVIFAWEQIVNTIIKRISSNPEELDRINLKELYNILNNASKHIPVLSKDIMEVYNTKKNNNIVEENSVIGDELIDGVLDKIQEFSQN